MEKVKNQKLESSVHKILLIIIGSVLLNMLFSWFNNIILKSPIFMDSIFTVFAAMTAGPVAGVIVGALTNVGMEFIYGITGYYWPFAGCNILTGLIIGIMSRKGLFHNIFNLMVAIVLLTLVNALVGSFIAYFVFGGHTEVQIDIVMDAMIETGLALSTALFWARIPTNLIDKMLSVYLAFLLYYYYTKRNGRPLKNIF